MKKCVGTEPSALLYIGNLVTSTTTGHGGSVVSPLASQAQGRGSIPSCGTSSPPTTPKYFSISFQLLSGQVSIEMEIGSQYF